MDTLWIKIALKNTEKMPELDFLWTIEVIKVDKC
jgi:hypothetical protein